VAIVGKNISLKKPFFLMLIISFEQLKCLSNLAKLSFSN
jgi:hypothetical protein